MRRILLFLSSVTTLTLSAQVIDSFDDGNFSFDPSWTGDVAEFTIDPEGRLRLNNEAPSSNNESYLSLPSEIINEATWEFRVGFDGLSSTGLSGSNSMLVFLTSDRANLEDNPEGYYVVIGGTNDEVSLFSSASGSPIIDGADDVTQVSSALISVRITRDLEGNWELSIDPTGGETYQPQGAANNADFTSSAFFGILCDYTSTRSTRFFFDDFSVTGLGEIDTTAPTIVDVAAISESQIQLAFSEVVNGAALDFNNYQLNNGGVVTNITKDVSDPLVYYVHTEPLINGENYELTLTGIQDLAGNTLENPVAEFQVLIIEKAEYGDVVVNEFYARPSDESPLPNEEFVELYNTSSKFIELEGWKLSDATGSSSALEAFILEPDHYLILTANSSVDLYQAFGTTIGVGNFRSLNNSGDVLILTGSNEEIIFETSYNFSADGVTTELINPLSPDQSSNNYAISINPSGGTPGAINSIFDDTPDTTPPTITSVSVLSANELLLTLNESIQQESAENPSNYRIDGGLLVSLAVLEDNRTAVHLSVSGLTSGVVQELEVSGLLDLWGNEMVASQIEFEFIQTEEVEAGDLVINEFYASPSAGSGIPNVEFVELLNVSGKFLNTEGWVLSDASNSSNEFTSFVIRPEEYIVLTETDNASLFPSDLKVLEINNFPSLNNGGDQISLSGPEELVISSIGYTGSQDGVTAELINPYAPDFSESNYGLSIAPSGGTPGAINSIFDDTPDITPPTITSVSVLSANELLLTLNESIQQESAENPSNYRINGESLVSLAVLEDNRTTVHLTVSDLTSGVVQELEVSGLLNLWGNEMTASQIEFEFIQTEEVEAGDLVINEFYASPSTASSIPSVEFVELLNVSGKFLNTEGCVLSDASNSSNEFTSFVIRPGEFIILTETDNAILFPSDLNVLEINNFPSLNNGGDHISLSGPEELVIASINYTGSQDGVTTELINPYAPDFSESNYELSTAPSGGTPGTINSIFDDTPDITPPRITSVSVLSANKLLLTLNESIQQESAENPSNYQIDGELLVNLVVLEDNRTAVHLTVSDLTSGVVKELEVSGLQDLWGNEMAASQIEFEFIQTEAVEAGDLVINEFYASPSAGSGIPNAEFVELLNVSGKFLNTEGCVLSDASNSSNEFTSFVIRPGEFIILTETDNAILFPSDLNVLEINNFPSLNNGGDHISLSGPEELVIASIHYTGSQDGVTTELINPYAPDFSESNYELSTAPSGGTPGTINSIFDDTPDTTPPGISYLKVLSSTELLVSFNEPIKNSSLVNVDNYSIQEVEVQSAASIPESVDQVSITTSSLPHAIQAELVVTQIEDLSGNILEEESITFTFYETEEVLAGDLLINEFLSDPIDGPNDFVELYNRSSKYLNTTGWTLSDESSVSSSFPSLVFPPDSYLVIYDEDATESFETEYSIPLPSLTLNNTSDVIQIADENGNLLVSISYENETEKGRSLELLNPFATCITINNYQLSMSADGQTVGAQNSVFSDEEDTEGPTFVGYVFNGELTISFSELLDPTSVSLSSFVVEGLEISELIHSAASAEVVLSFQSQPIPGVIYECVISNLKDCEGNAANPTAFQFGVGRSPGIKEILITEIMADPEPSNGLPDIEYVEIYNNSDQLLSTGDVLFSDSNSSTEIGKYLLQPFSHYVLSRFNEAFENTLVVNSFPSLSNDGEQLTLDLNGTIIDGISYDKSWHNDNCLDGGCSLERIDYQQFCLINENWSSSANQQGGTPGFSNSITSLNPDNFGPQLVNVAAINSEDLRLHFDERIDPESVSRLGITTNPGTTFNKVQQETSLSLVISLDGLQEEVLYEFDISNIADCFGNEVQPHDLTFAIPSEPETGDILLSEILFNPRAGGVDFVEIYNNSVKYIDLQGWSLARLNSEGLDAQRIISDEALVLEPYSYFVFTEDPEILFSQYPGGNHETFVELNSLPGYSNDTGNVVLLDHEGIVQQHFRYDKEYHYDLLSDEDGVSLERISFTVDVNDPNNWRSASGNSNYASPGRVNSQSVQIEAATKISIEPKLFIPGEGMLASNFTLINYSFDQPGRFANIHIYDAQGRAIKEIANGDLLGTEGFFRWDGVTDQGSMARMGYYIVVFEVFDSSGFTEVIRETVVVGRDF